MSPAAGRWLLVAGALAGLALAGVALLTRTEAAPDLPPEVVAVVDGRPILRSDYERALRAVASDRTGGLQEADRRRVLERLIDEELLVQHGLELGLAQRDPRIRAELGAAVMALLTARAEEDAAEVDEATLRAFHEEHRGWFRTAPRFELEHVYFRVRDGEEAEARERAHVARERLEAGEGIDGGDVGEDRHDVPLPRGLLPLAKLRDYLGPSVADAVAQAEDGAVVGPVRAGGGHHVLRVVKRLAGVDAPFEAVHEQVRAEYLRRAGEARLRQFLEARRSEARVRVAPEVL
jgi:hypothetical protein